MISHQKAAICGGIAVFLHLFSAAPAKAAAKIVLNDIGGVTGSPAELGFKIAASYWEHVLTNNVTLHFNVGLQSLGHGVLGGTDTTWAEYVPTSYYYDKLKGAASSTLDAQAIAHLPTLSATGSVTAIVPAYVDAATKQGVATSGTRIAPDNHEISNTLGLASANLQAISGIAAPVDATIVFSSNYAFDYNPSDGIAASSYDFIAVAIHEMGHALGFLTAAEDFNQVAGVSFSVDAFWWGYAADLFRYSAPGKLNWAFGTNSYFSLDGGQTAFGGNAYYSSGRQYGDGWQPSHWKAPPGGGCANVIGIMNPYTCPGTVDAVTAADLAVFDAIGWNLNVDVLANPSYHYSTAQAYLAYQAANGGGSGGVPEPASWALLLAGAGLAGGAMRYRRRRTTLRYA